MDRTTSVKIEYISLVGLSGTGKTTVGKILAKKLNAKLLDSDKVIEKQEKLAVTEIFKNFGEAHFRKLETDFLLSLTVENAEAGQSTSGRPNLAKRILSCGGGLPITPGNMDCLLALGQVVYLQTSTEKLVERLATAHDRPLLKNADKNGEEQNEHVLRSRLSELFELRHEVFERAQIIVKTDGLTPQQVADRVIANLKASKS
ncbi:MAG: shikimate kinase [Leptolyngbya sp.]|nr:shikimate kinase [Candidatus Melainabacteria bacterium]